LINRIASIEVQAFLREHEYADEKKLVLKHKTLFELPAAVLANQLKARRKAKDKLPSYYLTEGIVYPPSLNLEQSSSEATAQIKAAIINNTLSKHISVCADLTGGLGVDSFYFSTLCREVHYVEPDHELLTIARHNHKTLGVTSITYHPNTAETFLEQCDGGFDFIYIDPSRRSTASKKVFRLADCEPDVTRLQELIFKKTSLMMVKTSPLLDIQQGMAELAGTTDVYVLSVDNECKEVLFLCLADVNTLPVIHAINLAGQNQDQFSFSLEEELNAESAFSDQRTYLYEPNASLLKCGAFKVVGTRYALFKLHPNTHLYTSHALNLDFPGRIFQVLALVKPDKKTVKAFFAGGKGNVITRNYPLSVDELKVKVGLHDGGDQYLIAFSSLQGKRVVVADRLK